MSQIIRTTVLSIQENRNTPRLWISGKYLLKAGFVKGCKIKVSFRANKIIILADESGKKIVSAKRDIPIIDINNQKITKSFKVSEKVKAVIENFKIIITKSKQFIRKQTALKDGSYGSLFSGDDLLGLSAQLNRLTPKFHVEIDSQFADICQTNHKGIMFNMDIADVEYSELPKVEFLLAGIPCKPFSQIHQLKPEEHDQIDLSMFFLIAVEAINPRTIILEEVPDYAKSEIGIATINALKRMGYNVEIKHYSGNDFGELQKRKRTVIIASYDKIKLPELVTCEKTMSEILVDENHPELRWFDKKSLPWFFKLWDEHKAKYEKTGNGSYMPQVITKDSTSIAAITSGYYKVQLNNPIVKHPTKKGTYRLLIPSELKKLFNVPESFFTGKARMTSGQVLGQGVIVNVFSKIIGEMIN